MRLDLGPSLDALKAAALRQIDLEAEEARLRFVTAGSGQATEYLKTETEARAYLQAPGGTLVDWPYLAAEQAALDSVNIATTLREVAELVMIQASAWAATGALIKQLRRTAKLKVAEARTAGDVRAAVQIAWPQPPVV